MPGEPADRNAALKFALSAGEIMLLAGAETYRVEDTIMRLLGKCGYSLREAFVTPTGIFISVEDGENPGGEIITMLRRVKSRENDFGKIVRVNSLSRRFTQGSVSLEEAASELERIAVLPHYHLLVQVLCCGLACFSFTYIFKGSLPDCVNAFITGVFLRLFQAFMRRKGISAILQVLLGAAMITVSTLLLLRIGIGRDKNITIIGSIMPLVPGIALTNAIRDVFGGDYLSGSARILDAVIVAVCIATGVGSVLRVWSLLGGVL